MYLRSKKLVPPPRTVFIMDALLSAYGSDSEVSSSSSSEVAEEEVCAPAATLKQRTISGFFVKPKAPGRPKGSTTKKRRLHAVSNEVGERATADENNDQVPVLAFAAGSSLGQPQTVSHASMPEAKRTRVNWSVGVRRTFSAAFYGSQ